MPISFPALAVLFSSWLPVSILLGALSQSRKEKENLQKTLSYTSKSTIPIVPNFSQVQIIENKPKQSKQRVQIEQKQKINQATSQIPSLTQKNQETDTFIQALETSKQQLQKLQEQSNQVYSNLQKVYLDYKDTLKNLLGLNVLILSKTALNNYIDQDYLEKFGDLIEALPVEALKEGIHFFNTGYFAGKVAGVDVKNKSITEIMSYGQEPNLITKMDKNLLQILDVINQHIPHIFETQLAAHKIALDQLAKDYEALKLKEKLKQEEITNLLKLMKIPFEIEKLKTQIEESKAKTTLHKARVQDIQSKVQERKAKQETKKDDTLLQDLELLKQLFKK